MKKILRTSNQLSDEPASIRTQPSIQYWGTSNGRENGNNGIRFGYGYGSGRLQSKAAYAIDPTVEISLYHRLDMQSSREILFTAGFWHWKEWTLHQTPLYQA